MHFGRVETLTGIDLTLPPDSPRTEKFLSLPRSSLTQVYVGCPIWSSLSWKGVLYPKRTAPKDFLSVYASRFPTVEVNSTFYHLLDSHRISEWRCQTPQGFKFCPKVFRGITEGVLSSEMPTLVKRYCESIAAFEDRLGLSFAQFGEGFGPGQIGALKKFLEVWPRQFPLAVELRHRGWFQANALKDEVVNLFYKFQVSTVMTDTPGRRDALHLSLTQPKVLIRFQGSNGDPSDTERIEQWAKRIDKWQSSHLEEIYFFTHQPSDEKIPETADLAMKAILGKEAQLFSKTPLAEQAELGL